MKFSQNNLKFKTNNNVFSIKSALLSQSDSPFSFQIIGMKLYLRNVLLLIMKNIKAKKI